MTKARMDDLRAALRRAHWEIISESEDEPDCVNWIIAHEWKNLTLELEFWHNGPMGESTNDLKDICRCTVLDFEPRISLHFCRKCSAKWLPSVSALWRS